MKLRPQDSASNVQIKQEITDECSTLAKKQKVWDFLKGDVIDMSNDETSATPEEELKAFLSEPVRVSDPLKWWQLNENFPRLSKLAKFPRLSKLAKQYLSVLQPLSHQRGLFLLLDSLLTS